MSNNKQNSLNNVRTVGTADAESRRANVTFQSQPKTLTMKPPSASASASIKNGSKRRANSNHTTDKKVNLDKFLSVVQQRSNFTPSNGINGRMAPQGITHLYKPGDKDKNLQYSSPNITLN